MTGERRRRLVGAGLALGVLALVVWVLVLVTAGPHRHLPAPPSVLLPARPAPSATLYGAAVNDLFNDGPTAPGQLAASLQALRASGAGVARSDALWEASEPAAPVGGRHVFRWAFDDLIASACARAGLRWLPILDYSPGWVQSVPGADHSPPRSAADYAAYARAFAGRYGANGTFWATHPGVPRDPVATVEIWNEPDNPEFWVPRPNPAAYGALYLTARRAIDAVDPAIRVLVGGLTQPTTFLPAMLRADPGLAGHLDGVAIHPYGPPDTVLARVAGARATLRAIGQGTVPLYVTEFGWTTSPPGSAAYAPAPRRAGYLRETLAGLSAAARGCGLASVIVYAWTTPQTVPDDAADWYGIHGPGDGAVQSAFIDGLRPDARAGALGARRPTNRLCVR